MEKGLYWNSFQTVGFAVPLSGDFHSKLMIPKKFSENLRRKLPEKVAIRGPGAHSDDWEVQVSTSNNTTSFGGEGWKEFVNAFSLKETDILIFRYKKNSYFKVLVYEGQSDWVENEFSYFVKKTAGQTMDCEKKHEGSTDVRPESSPQLFSARNESGKQGRSENQIEERDQNPKKRDSRVRASTEVVEDSDNDFELTTKRKYNDPEWRPAKICREDDSGNPPKNAYVESRVHPENVRRGSVIQQLAFPTNAKGRRGAACTCLPNYSFSEEKKARAKQRASQKITEDSFYAVMTCSLVHRTFRLSLPKSWTDRFMTCCNQDVFLRLNGIHDKKWRVRYNCDRKRGGGVFVSGWKQFVHDNTLSVFDVCVFKHSCWVEKKVWLDVQIFKVNEDEGDEPQSNVVMGLASKKV